MTVVDTDGARRLADRLLTQTCDVEMGISRTTAVEAVSIIKSLAGQLDVAQGDRDRLAAEVEAMRAVVEAAEAWCDKRHRSVADDEPLYRATDTYRARKEGR